MTRTAFALSVRCPKMLFYACALLSLFFASCSTIPTGKPIAPTVEIADIRLVKLGLTKQELDFTLDVFNPNNFNLPVNTLEFIASSDDQAIAQGASKQAVLLLAKTSTQVVINVQAQANRALRKLLSHALSGDKQLGYAVTGFVKLDNWPTRIPFNVDKILKLDGS